MKRPWQDVFKWSFLKAAEKKSKMRELLKEAEEEESKMSELLKEAEEEKIKMSELLGKTNQEKEAFKEKIEEEVKCPVCLMVPRSDKIPVCRNGHITCGSCKR